MDTITENDHALVMRARSGDRAAFAQLYDRHVRPVYWQAYGIVGEPTMAEDVTQDVFITAWQKMRGLTIEDSLLPWLMVTARYTALNARRGRLRRERNASQLTADIADDASVEREVDAGLVRAEIDKAIAALSQTDRRLYELCLDGDRTYEQAAGELGISHAAVRNRLSRLRARLRADLRSIRENS